MITADKAKEIIEGLRPRLHHLNIKSGIIFNENEAFFKFWIELSGDKEKELVGIGIEHTISSGAEQEVTEEQFKHLISTSVESMIKMFLSERNNYLATALFGDK